MTANLEMQILERLARIEQKVDDVKERVLMHVAEDLVFHTDIERRVRKSENWRAYTAGIAAAAGFFASNIKSFLFPN